MPKMIWATAPKAELQKSPPVSASPQKRGKRDLVLRPKPRSVTSPQKRGKKKNHRKKQRLNLMWTMVHPRTCGAGIEYPTTRENIKEKIGLPAHST